MRESKPILLSKYSNKLASIKDKIMFSLFPRTCPFCDEIISMNESQCLKCAGKVMVVGQPRCLKCGRPIYDSETEYCEECEKRKHLFYKGISAYVYSDIVKKSIYMFKYSNRRYYAKTYGETIGKEFFDEIKSWECDVLVPVPIHRERYRNRGYNQAELLAREISKYVRIPVDSKVIIRTVNTLPQKELDVNGRKNNLEKAFKITKSVVQYKKIILVDDIFTTGSTIDACAEIFLAAGVYKIYFISLSIGIGI